MATERVEEDAEFTASGIVVYLSIGCGGVEGLSDIVCPMPYSESIFTGLAVVEQNPVAALPVLCYFTVVLRQLTAAPSRPCSAPRA
jgi:hypothetical protein